MGRKPTPWALHPRDYYALDGGRCTSIGWMTCRDDIHPFAPWTHPLHLVGHFLMMTSYEGLMEMLGFAATWTPHDVTGNLMMVFTLLALLDDDMWPLEAFSMPLRA
jgi:hypothetical protein